MKWKSYLKMGIAHWVVLLVVGMVLGIVGLSAFSVAALQGGVTFSTGALLVLAYLLITWLVSGWVQPKIVGSRWLNSEKLL